MQFPPSCSPAIPKGVSMGTTSLSNPETSLHTNWLSRLVLIVYRYCQHVKRERKRCIVAQFETEDKMLPLIFSFSTRELVKTLVKTRIPLDQRILDSLVIRLWVVLMSGSTPAAWLLPLHVQCFIPILLNIAYMRDGLYRLLPFYISAGSPPRFVAMPNVL